MDSTSSLQDDSLETLICASMATPNDSTITSVEEFSQHLALVLRDDSNIKRDVISSFENPSGDVSATSILTDLSSTLRSYGQDAEATIIDYVVEKAVDSPSHGGLGINSTSQPTPSQYAELLFLVSAHLTSFKSRNNARSYLLTLTSPTPDTQPMTLAQKIFAQHALSPIPATGLSTSTVLRVGVDWILASELTWGEMARTHSQLGNPGIWRNDRFWLAGDHFVHPDVMHMPRIKGMLENMEWAKREFKMTEYQGANYTIMHTEFVRERAEPGMLAVGSDSHTCSGGAIGCLSIGLGAADVMLTLSLGETWFKVPESIKIEFVGKPRVGVSGKDVILHVLGELKRNTVASERIVEFMGEGCKHLSVDARFAICNMCTEFGAVTGVFVPDEITKQYVDRRRRKANKLNSVYFKPDDGAVYASTHTIDLAKVENTIAVYPEPDHIVPVSDKAGMKLDGVFIGACTTTEEELVLAALVLKVGLAKNLPTAKGKRHYVPGSLPIVDKLKDLGLLEVYQAAGFTRGPPGCSYCVGLSAEKAEKGETWLSSQNRNFKNRMGAGKCLETLTCNHILTVGGSFGNLSSAIVCAASSFSLTITDPAPFIAEMDIDWFNNRYRQPSSTARPASPLTYTHPDLQAYNSHSSTLTLTSSKQIAAEKATSSFPPIHSRIITLGNLIDTDALSPGTTLGVCESDAEFGEHCLEHTHPHFRAQIQHDVYKGSAVVIAGKGFGVGSSRESAVSALKGCGVRCVVAKSFAFIFGRNLPSLGLLGFVMPEESDFWDVAWGGEGGVGEGREVEVDVERRKVRVDTTGRGQWREWGFELSEMEFGLTVNKGVTESFRRFGRGIWEEMMRKDGEVDMGRKEGGRGPQNVGEIDGDVSLMEREMAW